MEKIEVTIEADGSINYGVKGVKGGKCVALTQHIDELAGGAVVERTKTGEFCAVEQPQQVKQGRP